VKPPNLFGKLMPGASARHSFRAVAANAASAFA